MRTIAAIIATALMPAAALRSDCTLTSIGVTPLPDVGPHFYKGFQGGLYPRGGNPRPPSHDAAGRAIAGSQIQPLDSAGNPNPATGKVVLISVGMSNTTQEFATKGSGALKPRADLDPAKNPRLVIVDGAQGGRDATRFTDPNAPSWQTIDSRLAAAGVTPAQVQVVWLKQSLQNITQYGVFPAHARTLQDALETIARNLKIRYPNVKIAYVSSRTRSYNGGQQGTNPEPYSFEVGFSTKWMIEKQISGDASLNYDPARGPVVAPWLAWGPYLWVDGTTPRSDGLTWVCSDLESDFTHPTATGGVPKVATQLLAFFKSDATATPWFLRHSVTGAPPIVTASADSAGGYAPLAVNFSASATDPDGTIVGYQWTFGDGTFSTAQSPAKTFRSPGIHEVHLTVTDNSGNTAHATVSLTVKLSFAEWRRIYFTAAELDDQQISGALADPDTDGLANLAEYACGSHPKMADAAVFTARRTDGQLTLTYPRAKHAADVTITVEAASNLAGPWNSAAGSSAEQVLADDGVVETVVATDLAPSNGQRFLRLRIDRISPASSTVKRP